MKPSRGGLVLKYVILILASLVVLLPVLWMLSTSLKDTTEIMSGKISWIPKNITFDAYVRIFVDYPFASYYKSSIIITFCATAVTVLFSLLSAYGVTRFQFKGKGSYLTFLLMTQMFPSIMMLIPYYKVLRNFHINDSYLGMIVIYIAFTIPMCSWMMKGYLQTIPISLDESAMLDGCHRLQILFRIVAPLALPGIAATAIYAFIQTWNEYMFASILINTETIKTLPVGIGQLNGYYKIDWNDMMAACLVASVPILIVYIALQKYFIASLTAGAVKQ